MDVKAASMLLLSLFIITGAFTQALDTEGNRVSAENRQDHPNFDDLSSFFDFELLPPSPSSKSPKPKGRYHYSYHPGGPYYPEDQYVPPPSQQGSDDEKKVTPGSTYRSQKENSTISMASVGGYQVAVVGMDSPMLKDLGLTQEDLVKLAEQKGSTKRISPANASLLGSDSVHSASYAEQPPPQGSYSSVPHSHGGYYPSSTHNKQPWKPHTDWDDKGTHHHTSASTHYHPHPHYHESTPYYPKKPEGYGHSSQQHPHHHTESSPYHKKTEGYTPHSSYHPPQHTDSAVAYHKKPEGGYTSYSSYQPADSTYPKKESYGGPSYHQDSYYQKKPEGHSNPDTSSRGYGTSSHHSTDSPAYAKKPDGSYYHPRYQAKYPSSSGQPRYKYSSSGSKPYSSSAESPSYSSYSKNRAGSTYPHSYDDHHESDGGQKGITIRFKAKTPGGSGGLNIPVNINPLAVVKKLLPLTSVLNPLNNKKVTIGITIENKKEQHQHAY